MAYDPNNIFARILRGEIPCGKVHEDAHVLAFNDIQPKAPVHILVIPKGKYVSIADFGANASQEEISAFYRAVAKIAADNGLAEDGFRVIACTRQGQGEPLDVADAASIAALGERLKGVPVDIVVNNAAIRGDTGGLASLSPDDFLDVMRVNALAPLLLARALRENLLAGARRVLANISSRAGSLAEGTLDDDDGDYAYRCSKAALNMARSKPRW